MTAVMRRFHARLGDKDRYPLPPREIVTSVVPAMPDNAARNTAIVAHFAYGALSGAALAPLRREPAVAFGVAGGAGIWLASYFGWIPAFAVLKPAQKHPAPRNAGMIMSHIVWGACFSLAQRELVKARWAFDGGPIKDRA
jgi:uncharacterized membrane protein YagU involved in acid resistance